MAKALVGFPGLGNSHPRPDEQDKQQVLHILHAANLSKGGGRINRSPAHQMRRTVPGCLVNP